MIIHCNRYFAIYIFEIGIDKELYYFVIFINARDDFFNTTKIYLKFISSRSTLFQQFESYSSIIFSDERMQ